MVRSIGPDFIKDEEMNPPDFIPDKDVDVSDVMPEIGFDPTQRDVWKTALEFVDIPFKPLHWAQRQAQRGLEAIGGPLVEEPEVTAAYTIPEAPPGVLEEETLRTSQQ